MVEPALHREVGHPVQRGIGGKEEPVRRVEAALLQECHGADAVTGREGAREAALADPCGCTDFRARDGIAQVGQDEFLGSPQSGAVEPRYCLEGLYRLRTGASLRANLPWRHTRSAAEDH